MTTKAIFTAACMLLAGCEAASTRVAERPGTQVQAQQSASSTVAMQPAPAESLHAALVTPDSVEVMGDADDELSPPVDDSTAFNCAPRKLHGADTLVFTLAVPHGAFLWVKAPNDLDYALVNRYPNSSGSPHSLVASDAFEKMSVVKIPASIMWPPSYFGRDTIPERVFSQPGDYQIFMGDNYGTDYGGPNFICTVSYIP
jgi:hypothetical protein